MATKKRKGTGNEATTQTQAAIDAFHDGFAKAMDEDQKQIAAMPKTHDVSKGEFADDVDPKVADKFLED
jgi:hypothetical protein